MKVAYADPPYIGCAKYYPEGQEVDHLELLQQLVEGYDGWALSCSSVTLRQILALPTCPPEVRIGAWVKPWASFKPNVNPAYCWEPLLFLPSRVGHRDKPTVRDWVSANQTLKKGLVGAKPWQFCMWLFALLGVEVGDTFVDLFPGTGIVGDAWRVWCDQQNCRQMTLPSSV